MFFQKSDLLPCQVFFSLKHFGAAIVALLMQLSLILWPVAALWARKTTRLKSPKAKTKPNIDTVLAEIAMANRVQIDPYAKVSKKFRQPV